MRVALVGLGDIGLGAHLPALLRHPAVEVAALVDPVPERVDAALSLAPDVPAGGDLDLADIPAVVLATPPWVTPGLAVRHLCAGRYVLAEKPVATNTAAAISAYEVLTPAEQARLQIGLTYRHDPALRRLREWIVAGRLGGPLLVRAHIYDEPLTSDAGHTARITATLAHGTPVIHEGAHVFDWLSYLLEGQPEVDDAWAVLVGDLPAPNLTGARLSYPAGHVALVEFGWLTAALPRCELSFLGPAGLAVLDGSTFRLTLTTDAGIEVFDAPGDRTARCFDLQVGRFVDLVEGRSDAEPSLADGIAALATAEQVAATV